MIRTVTNDPTRRAKLFTIHPRKLHPRVVILLWARQLCVSPLWIYDVSTLTVNRQSVILSHSRRKLILTRSKFPISNYRYERVVLRFQTRNETRLPKILRDTSRRNILCLRGKFMKFDRIFREQSRATVDVECRKVLGRGAGGRCYTYPRGSGACRPNWFPTTTRTCHASSTLQRCVCEFSSEHEGRSSKEKQEFSRDSLLFVRHLSWRYRKMNF